MRLRRFGLVAAAAVVAVCASGIAAAPRAEARVFVGFGFGVPAVYPVPVYAPPPVYYAPPPVYYRAGIVYGPRVIYRRRVVHHVRRVVHRSCGCACP
jgi:hypothetical protein